MFCYILINFFADLLICKYILFRIQNMLDKFSPLVYQVASISQLLWKEYLSYFEDAQMMMKIGESKLFAFPSFTLEVFHRLYYEPEPERLDPPPPESAWAEKLHAQFSQVIGFEELVEQCCGNQLAAGLATVEYCRKVYEKIPPPIPRFANPQEYRDMIRKLLQNRAVPPSQVFKDALDPHSLNHPIGWLPPKTRQQQDKKRWLQRLIERSEDDSQAITQLLQQEGKQAVKMAQEYAASLEATQVRQMLRAALAASEQKLEESAQWLEMLGLSWGQSASFDTQVSPEKKLLLAQKIAGNEQLKQIALLAGRFKAIAERKRRSKAKDAVGEITSIELGNDLSRLLPSELQKLASPDLFPLFALGYYDRSLLQYKTSGKEKQSKGPLVICLDSSGSMDGLPDTWAKAVTAVLGQIAYQEHRHLRVIHFTTSVCRIDDFPPRHQDYSRLLDSMLAFFAGGGTKWEPAMKAAMDCIEQQQCLLQADIVLVTDGRCDLEQGFVEMLHKQKQQLEFSVYGVLIGAEGVTKLNKFCDRVWAVKNLEGDDAIIEELFLL